jgi:esterase/lipase
VESNDGGEKRMKKITISVMLIALVILSAFFSVSSAEGCCFRWPKRAVETTYGTYNGMEYTQITGKLGKADYVIYMPESWNGRFVIGCTGYNYFQDPHPEFTFDPQAKWLVSEGYAFAASNYNGGERAWLVKEGMISTLRLTIFVACKYHVTDKIFLIGGSMGGLIALNLGQKYPMLYSGVLDVCGSKGSLYEWQYANIWVTYSVPEIRAILSIPDTVPDTQLAGLKAFFTQLVNDITVAFKGTREDRPKAYERYDATLHADISIPVISVVGGVDPLVPLPTHFKYQAAVEASGHSDLYRLYVIPDGGHIDQPILDVELSYLNELIAWADSLD